MDSPKTSLSPQLLEKARLELNEDWNKVPDQIKSLRERILEDPKRNFRTDDAFLLRFLRARKFDEDRTLELMINYYKQRDKNPQFFSKTCADLNNVLSSKMYGILPTKDKNGSAIAVANVSQWDVNAFSLEEIFAYIILSLESLIEDEEVQVCGVIYINNMKGLGFKHLLRLNPLVWKRADDCLIKCFPIRYKAIFCTNEPPIFRLCWNIVRPFMSSKIMSRTHFLGRNFDKLYEHCSVDILPEEFEGKAGNYNNSPWNEILKQHQEIAAENLKFGFNR